MKMDRRMTKQKWKRADSPWLSKISTTQQGHVLETNITMPRKALVCKKQRNLWKGSKRRKLEKAWSMCPTVKRKIKLNRTFICFRRRLS